MKHLLIASGDTKERSVKLADGEDHKLYFKQLTPDEIASFLGAVNRIPDTEKGDIERQKLQANLIALSMRNETGEPLMSKEEAGKVPVMMKLKLCSLIIECSGDIGDIKNV